MKTRQTAIFAAGALAVVLAGAQTLNLNPHKTRAAKGDILNTAQIVTDVNMTGVSTSITAYVGQIVAPLATTQQVAAAVAGLASTGYVAQAVAPLPTTQRVDAVASAAAYAYSPTNPPPAAGGDVVSVNGQTGVVSVTLAQAAAAGGFAGTEDIEVGSVATFKLGVGAGVDATGENNAYTGWDAGVESSASYTIFIHGGQGLAGELNAVLFGGQGAYGYLSSYIGYCGGGSTTSNSVFVGSHSGRTARGNNRLYIDTYATDPFYQPDGATNDVIFSDAGHLYLGRGAGAPGGAQGGTLRGPWKTDAGLTVAGTLTASTVRDATSAGGSLQNANGQACLTWGAGNGTGVSTADGMNVAGALAVTGATTLSNTAVNGTLTVNGEPVGQCPVWQSMGLMPNAGGIQYPTITQIGIDMAFSATNLWFVIPHPAPRSHIVIQLQAFGTTTAASTNPVSLAVTSGGGYGAMTSPGATQTTICDPATLTGLRSTNIVYIAPAPEGTTRGGAFLRFDLFRPNTLANGNGVTFLSPFWRCATSNEIATKTFAQ